MNFEIGRKFLFGKDGNYSMLNSKKLTALFFLVCSGLFSSSLIPVEAATTLGYGLFVPTSNSNVYWPGTTGNENYRHLYTSDNEFVNDNVKIIHAVYGRTIYIKPGSYKLSMSESNRTSANTFDISISNSETWHFENVCGDAIVSKEKYRYYDAGYPMEWWYVVFKNLELGDIIKVRTSRGGIYYLVCGPKSMAAVDILKDNVIVNGQTFNQTTGDNVQLTADAKFNGIPVPPSEVRWTSSNSNIAAVSDGLVTCKGMGNATITASWFNSAMSSSKSVTSKVVDPNFPVITKVELGSAKGEVKVTGKYTVQYGYSTVNSGAYVSNWQPNTVFTNVAPRTYYFFGKDDKGVISLGYQFTMPDTNTITYKGNQVSMNDIVISVQKNSPHAV